MAKRTKRNRRFGVPVRRAAPGAPPGSVLIDPRSPKPVLSVIAFGPDKIAEKRIARPDDVRPFLEQFPIVWLNVDGLGDADVVQELGDLFQIHPLALEDIVNRHQRAKVEQYGEATFFVTHMIEMTDHLDSEQLSIYFTRDFVLTFQDRPGGDCLEPIRDRLRKNGSKLRALSAGYLAYALIDAVIDHYFPVLEAYGERLEDLEDRILAQPRPSLTAEIHDVKRELLNLRRTIWPQREALSTMIRDPLPTIDEETKLYLRDCYDHAIRIIDLIETYREVGSDLMDLYLSSISNRMNEIMKVLTVISTLFIPLTFVVGIYGMNFNTQVSPWNMPELNWYFGYPLCLALMLAISIGQLIFFRRRGWIGKPKDKPDPPEASET